MPKAGQAGDATRLLAGSPAGPILEALACSRLTSLPLMFVGSKNLSDPASSCLACRSELVQAE